MLCYRDPFVFLVLTSSAACPLLLHPACPCACACVLHAPQPPLAFPTLQDHLTGKQYLGWKKIREVFAELKAKRSGGGGIGGPATAFHGSSERSRSRGDEQLPPPPGERPGGKDDKEREREREGRHDERRRERSRSPGRERRYDRGYERDRGYEHDRGHGRDRGYERGGYERERGYERDRDHDRSRDYRRVSGRGGV